MNNQNVNDGQRETVVQVLAGVPVPKVGDGATECLWSDRHAYTVVQVVSPTCVVVQRDIAKRTDDYGMSDIQRYAYERDPSGARYVLVHKVTKRHPSGRWVRKGDGVRGNPFVLGVRDEHYDYSF